MACSTRIKYLEGIAFVFHSLLFCFTTVSRDQLLLVPLFPPRPPPLTERQEVTWSEEVEEQIWSLASNIAEYYYLEHNFPPRAPSPHGAHGKGSACTIGRQDILRSKAHSLGHSVILKGTMGAQPVSLPGHKLSSFTLPCTPPMTLPHPKLQRNGTCKSGT